MRPVREIAVYGSTDLIRSTRTSLLALALIGQLACTSAAVDKAVGARAGTTIAPSSSNPSLCQAASSDSLLYEVAATPLP
jgi:hypothetical protein